MPYLKQWQHAHRIKVYIYMSKGSGRRPTDEQQYKDNYEKIFGKKNNQPAKETK